MVQHVIFDSNIWISFAIGKRLNELKTALTHPNVKVYICKKLLREVSGTIQKSKFLKYISFERRQMLLELMKACYCVEIVEQVQISRDPNDNFLLDLAVKVNAGYLITGDQDLLILKKYHQTNIISFNSFLAILDTIPLMP